MDAELIEYELRRAKFPFRAQRVDTREAFVAALEEFRPDVILSDYTLPRFDGMAALALAKERAPGTPLIIVTGSINEETAVGCMKAGAADYLLKGNLSRIGPAIEAALARARARAHQSRAEAALRRSEANLRALFHNSLQCFVLVDANGTIQALNRPAKEWAQLLIGQEPREGMSITRFIPGTAKFFTDALQGVAQTIEYAIPDTQGVVRWFESSAAPVVDDAGDIIGVCLSAVNIDERRRAAEALSASERRFRSLVQNSSDLVIVLHADGQIAYASDSATRVVGLEPSALVGTNILALLPERDEAAMAALLASEGLIEPGPIELTLCRPDGVEVWLEAVATDLRADATIGGIVLNARDISERKLAERALRESEERYRSLFDNASDLVCMASPDGRLVYVNQAWHLATGYTGDELAERRLADLLHMDCRATVEAALAGVVAGEPVSHVEAVVVTKSGEALLLEGSMSGLAKDGAVGMICGIFRDVTQRRRMEDHLRRAERMQAAGRLAGGVAHEVNNMMTGVIGFASLLRNSFTEGDPRIADVREILRAAGRAADLTRQLLAFTRQQLRRVEPLDLNETVRGLERMLRRTVGEEHAFELRLHTESLRVAADRSQLEQVLVNLVLNARDAIDGTGRVGIETDIVTLDGSYTLRHPGVAIPPGRYAMLAVSDNGSGMTPEVQARIFEPFFTTKPVGRGTGLGLSTVYGIVKQSDGFIWPYSEVGVGTVFKVYLPLVERRSGTVEIEPMVTPEESRGTERVLIVEDEEVVRGLASRSLREHGYQVAEAPDGASALDYLERYSAQIDLVVSDVVMPTMGGRELGLRLAQLAPHIPVLYISGFTGDDVVNRGLLDPEAPFLQKPFAPEQLALKVRELLDRSRTEA